MYNLLPNNSKKTFSKRIWNFKNLDETGESFERKFDLLKASYFSKKTNLICLSDDSGLEIDLLKGEPGISFLQDGAGKKK